MGQIYSSVLQCFSRRHGKVRLTDEESAPAAGALSLSATQETDPVPIHIVVMGPTGSGKTTFVNLVSGSSLGVGEGLESCTSEVQTSDPFSVGDKKIVLIDTPGFGDTTLADSDIWKIIAASLVMSYRAGIRLTGVIYMQRISDVKVSGSARQCFKMFQELCGEETFGNVLLVTGMWDMVASDVGNERERELANKEIFFKPVLEKGAFMMRHDNTRESALEIIRHLVGRQPVTLQIQRELGGSGGADADILQTSVFKQMREVMSELVAQRQRKLDALTEEMAEAERNEDEETREELEEEVQAAKAELQEAQDKVSKLASEYQAELRRLEEMLQKRRLRGGE